LISQRSSRKKKFNKFNKLLLEAIDEALSSFGESTKMATYFHLENTLKIEKREIPFRIDDFQDALEKLFGPGARHLEIMFMKNLHAKVKTVYKMDFFWVVPELTFKEYVRLMRLNFEAAHENKTEMGILVNEHEELQK
jgi:hypothetical protein